MALVFIYAEQANMAKKGQGWDEAKLRQAIGDAIRTRHLQNKPIDEAAIQATYLRKSPNRADFIRSYVSR